MANVCNSYPESVFQITLSKMLRNPIKRLISLSLRNTSCRPVKFLIFFFTQTCTVRYELCDILRLKTINIIYTTILDKSRR